MQKTYYKTASLISNSCKAIALLAGQTTEVSNLAYEYGKNLVCTFFPVVFLVFMLCSSEKSIFATSIYSIICFISILYFGLFHDGLSQNAKSRFPDTMAFKLF